MLETMSAARRATLADLAALPDRPTTEIVDGQLVPKVAPSPIHSNSQLGFGAWARRRFDRAHGGRWPGGWWIFSEIHVGYEHGDVYCHDLAGWRRDRVPERPTEWPVQTRPDWVCEILSPGHEKRDLGNKLWTLQSEGVPHYWIIDREDKRLLIHRWKPEGYLHLLPITADQVVRAEPFDGVDLRMAILFGDEPDEE